MALLLSMVYHAAVSRCSQTMMQPVLGLHKHLGTLHLAIAVSLHFYAYSVQRYYNAVKLLLYQRAICQPFTVMIMPQVYLRNDMIIRVGELGREMYFIKAGVVQVQHPFSKLAWLVAVDHSQFCFVILF